MDVPGTYKYLFMCKLKGFILLVTIVILLDFINTGLGGATVRRTLSRPAVRLARAEVYCLSANYIGPCCCCDEPIGQYLYWEAGAPKT